MLSHKKWVLLLFLLSALSLSIVALPNAAHAATRTGAQSHTSLLANTPAAARAPQISGCYAENRETGNQIYNMYSGYYSVTVRLYEWVRTTNNSFCGAWFSTSTLQIFGDATCDGTIQSAVGVQGAFGLVAVKGLGAPVTVTPGGTGLARSQDVYVSSGRV
jgi:hypothetical protein